MANNSRKRAESETKAPVPKVPLLEIPKHPPQTRIRSYSQQDKTHKLISSDDSIAYKSTRSTPSSAGRISAMSLSSRSTGGESSSVDSLNSPGGSESSGSSSDKNRFTRSLHKSLKTTSHTGFFYKSHHSNSKHQHEKSTDKSYSFEKILNKKTLTLDYIKSFSPAMLKGYFTETANEFAEIYKEKDGYIIKAFENENKSTKNSAFESNNMVEILYIKNGNTVESYLLHKEKNLGEKNGNGSIFVAYPFPDFTSNIKDIYSLMISRVIAVKRPSESLTPTEVAARVLGLKANNQYINHCVFDEKEVYFLMNYINGPNVFDCVYDKALNKKRYLTPEIILQFDIQLFDLVNEFHAADYLHRDIKLENMMVKPKPNPSSFDVFLVDTDDAVPVRQKTRNINGSPGYPKLEINPEANFQADFYTKKTDRLLLGWSLAAIASHNNHHKQITELLPTKPYQKDYSHEVVCSLLPDVLVNNPHLNKDKALIEIFRAYNIQETWIHKPIDILFSYVSESLEDFVPSDIALLKENRKDIIDLIVYRLYIAPFRNQINIRLTMENPELRPDEHELPQLRNQMQNILIMYQQLAHRYNILYDKAQDYLKELPNIPNPFGALLELEEEALPKALNYEKLHKTISDFIYKIPDNTPHSSCNDSFVSLGKTTNNTITEEEEKSTFSVFGKK